MRAERIPVVDPDKDQIQGELAANSFSNRPSLTSLRDAKRDEAEPKAEEVEKIEQVKIPNPLDAEIVVDAPEPEVPVEPEEEQDPIRTEIELIKAELHELRASVNNQGTDIEDEHDDDVVLTTGPHRNKYTGEFAIYYKNSGNLFVDDGLIICPNGTGTWSASEEAFATNEYVVLKITLDSDFSFLSAELEAEATLADIVSEGLIHRRVIGKKLADPFYIQYHEGTIVIDGAEPKACASMSSNTTTWSTGVRTFDGLNHETNDNVLDVDLANDKIIVKEGFSGIYGIKMQAQLLIKLADPPGSAAIVAVVRKGGYGTECQAKMYVYKPTVVVYEEFVNEFSASIDEFVDASSGDVDLDVYVYVSVDGSDTAALTECRLDVHLIELTDSAT